MRRDEHYSAFVTQFAQQTNNLFFGLHINACEGFIQKDDLSILCQRPCKEHALALPARKFSDLTMAKVLHINPLQGTIDGVAIRL